MYCTKIKLFTDCKNRKNHCLIIVVNAALFYAVTLQHLHHCNTLLLASEGYSKIMVQVPIAPPAAQLYLMPQEVLQDLQTKLANLEMLIAKRNADDTAAEWIVSSRARRLLGVSPRTWQNIRDQRRIPFAQFGRKIFVKRADFEAFMNNHLIKS